MLAIAFARGEIMMRREFLAALERYFSFEILAIAPDARDSTEFTVRAKDHRGIFGFQITGHTCVIAAAAMTDVVDVQIEMIAPEEWRQRERFACAENIARGGLDPGAEPQPSVPRGSGRRADRASAQCRRRQNSGNVRFKNSFTNTPLSVAMPACSARCVFGRTPIPTTTKSQSNFVPSSSCTYRS